MVRKVYAGVVVDDLLAARAWYERVLGRPADAAPMDGLYEWNLATGASLQVVDIQKVRETLQRKDWGSFGSSSVAFVVESLADQLKVLADAGIAVGPQFTTATLRTATVSDPAGNLVTFVEELSASK